MLLASHQTTAKVSPCHQSQPVLLGGGADVGVVMGEGGRRKGRVCVKGRVVMGRGW